MIASGPESYIIDNIASILADAEERAARSQGLLAYKTRSELAQCCAQWFLDFFRPHVDGKPIFLEKTPSNLGHVELIHELFPRARIIHLCRDGRDVVYSLLHARSERQYDFPETFEGCARAWARIESALDFGVRNPRVYTELKYEELITDPHGTLTRLCESLGLSLTPAILDGMLRASQRRIHPSAATEVEGFVGKWRRFFTPAQVEQFKAIGGQQLIRLQYERDLNW